MPQAAPPPPHCGRKGQQHEAASPQPARDKGRGERRAGGPCACTSAQAPQALARTGEQVGRGSMLLSIAALVRASDLAICLTSRVRDEARQALTSHCTSLHGKPHPTPPPQHATSRPSGAKPSTALRPPRQAARTTLAHIKTKQRPMHQSPNPSHAHPRPHTRPHDMSTHAPALPSPRHTHHTNPAQPSSCPTHPHATIHPRTPTSHTPPPHTHTPAYTSTYSHPPSVATCFQALPACASIPPPPSPPPSSCPPRPHPA